MLDKNGIVVLGSGQEIEFLIRNINKTGIKLLAYGPVNESMEFSETVNFCRESGVRLVKNHEEAIKLKPDFIFMMSYAPLIPQEMIEKVKFINVHGALLPRYRGMHGGTWALINGEEKAGYTIHLVDEGIDSGPIYFQNSVDVEINDDINIVRKKISGIFESNILGQLKRVYEGSITPKLQDESESINVCRRRPEDSLIDWNWSSKRIHDFIRALAPPYTNGAYTIVNGKKLYIEGSTYSELPEYYGIPGQIVDIYDSYWVKIKTGNSALKVRVADSNCKEILDKVVSKVGVRCG